MNIKNKKINWLKKLIIFLFLQIISILSIFSQNKTIKGRVIDEYLNPLPGVLIMLDDKVEVTRTDTNGFFQIDVPIYQNKILFWYLGFEQTTINLIEKCKKIEIIMIYSNSYDFIPLKRVEKKIKKRYKNIPKTHKQAFDRGIFETEYPCFKYELKSFKN